MNRILVTALVLLAVSSARAQIAAGPSSQTFTNSELGLSMTYPAAFSREDPTHLGDLEFSTFAFKPQAETGSQSNCAHILLALSSGLDLPEEKPKKGQPAFAQAKGALTITEVDRACLDKTAVDDALLHDLVSSASKREGMMPLARITNYGVEQSTMWWTAQAGYQKDAKGRRSPSAGTAIAATAGASVHGHLLIWSIQANDPQLFNRFAGVWVCFSAPVCPAGSTQLTQFRLTVPRPAELASR